MKFEGKTFYLYVSQKEVSASPSHGTSQAWPWQVLWALGRCHPVLGVQGHSGSAGVTSPLLPLVPSLGAGAADAGSAPAVPWWGLCL